MRMLTSEDIDIANKKGINAQIWGNYYLAINKTPETLWLAITSECDNKSKVQKYLKVSAEAYLKEILWNIILTSYLTNNCKFSALKQMDNYMF